jgi:hypothetical protein
MVQNYATTGEKKVSHQNDTAMIGCYHFRSRRGGQIGARMRRARNAVDNAPKAKRRCRRFLGHGPDKVTVPKTLRRARRECPGKRRPLTFNLRKRFRCHFVESRRDGERFFLEIFGFDANLDLSLARNAIGCESADKNLGGSGFCFDVGADECRVMIAVAGK